MARAVCFFCAAKRSDAFPPNTPAGLRVRVLRLGVFTRGTYFPQLGPQLFVITGEAATSRSRELAIENKCYFSLGAG